MNRRGGTCLCVLYPVPVTAYTLLNKNISNIYRSSAVTIYNRLCVVLSCSLCDLVDLTCPSQHKHTRTGTRVTPCSTAKCPTRCSTRTWPVRFVYIRPSRPVTWLSYRCEYNIMSIRSPRPDRTHSSPRTYFVCFRSYLLIGCLTVGWLTIVLSAVVIFRNRLTVRMWYLIIIWSSRGLPIPWYNKHTRTHTTEYFETRTCFRRVVMIALPLCQ